MGIILVNVIISIMDIIVKKVLLLFMYIYIYIYYMLYVIMAGEVSLNNYYEIY